MTEVEGGWGRFVAPLAWLAEFDNEPAPNALPDAFGDRYLYRHNPIFASVRDAAIDLGYRFSAEDSPLWRDYQAFSLTALHRILEFKIIPYLDTGTSLRRLAESNPAAKLPLGFIARNLKRNYAFHESAHCVAHSVLRGFEAELREVATGEADRVVLEAILAESFANTVEALASVSQHMRVLDAIFFRLNSYYSSDPKREDVVSRAGSRLGAELRFVLLYLSYFEANLAVAEPSELTYGRIAEAGGCLSDGADLAREITDIGFGLTAGFRNSTTPAYFEFLGCASEYGALVKAGWLNDVRNRSFVRGFARRLWISTGNA